MVLFGQSKPPTISYQPTASMAITANVVSSEVLEQHKKFTVYRVVVKYDDKTWMIQRRYNEFSKLCDSVCVMLLFFRFPLIVCFCS